LLLILGRVHIEVFEGYLAEINAVLMLAQKEFSEMYKGEQA
jgi:hypothetical protein